MAPLFYHFGHYSFFLDLLTIGQDMIDTLGIYFMTFIFISTIIFIKNYVFQIHNKTLFKNYQTNKNTLPLLNYFSINFNSLKKLAKTFKIFFR